MAVYQPRGAIEIDKIVGTPTASGRNTVAVGSHREGGSGIRKDHTPSASAGAVTAGPGRRVSCNNDI